MTLSKPSGTLWHAVRSTIRSKDCWQRLALVSPTQNLFLTYEEAWAQSASLAECLISKDVVAGDVVGTDLPNVAESLLLHLACSRLGASVATAKTPDSFPSNMRLGVVASADSALLQHSPSLQMLVAGSEEMKSALDGDSRMDFDDEDSSPEATMDRPLGYFNSSTPYTQQQCLAHGRAMQQHLNVTPEDKACVSISLFHPFGIGTSVCGTWLAGATVVLPAVGGLHGCGVPSERAAVTACTLHEQECSLLFADKHTLTALDGVFAGDQKMRTAATSNLRGGISKMGSGSDILDTKVDCGGVALYTLGKKSR